MSSISLVEGQEAIKRLMQGNKRYIQDSLEHPNRTLFRRQAIISRQEPFATIVGCADSRVSPEIVFDQGLGDLFVVRVAGNVIGPLELDSIEFSVIHLGTDVILVLGHENCGAVDAVIRRTVRDIESVAELIQPSVLAAKKQKSSNLLEASIKANAIRMRNYLLKSPVIQRYMADRNLEVYAGYYHLKTGAVELLK